MKIYFLGDQIDPEKFMEAGIDLAPAGCFLESRQKIYPPVVR